MPQLDPSGFLPQLVWLAITFGLLYLVMSRVALPKISEVLETRAERIRDDLDRAARLKEESDEVKAAYEKALSEARSAAQAQLHAQAEAAAHAATERQAKIAAELAQRTREAEARIGENRKAAMANIRTVAGEVAQAAARKLVGLDVSAAEAETAVTNAMAERA